MKARDLKTFLFYLMKFVIFVNISFRISDTSRQHINLENAEPPATWRESRECKIARVPLTKKHRLERDMFSYRRSMQTSPRGRNLVAFEASNSSARESVL